MTADLEHDTDWNDLLQRATDLDPADFRPHARLLAPPVHRAAARVRRLGARRPLDPRALPAGGTDEGGGGIGGIHEGGADFADPVGTPTAAGGSGGAGLGADG